MKIKKILLSSALSFGMLISAVPALAAGTSSEVAVKSDEYDYDTIYRISPLPMDFQPTIEYNGYTYTLTRHYFDYSIGFYKAIYTKVV
ncbi:hypothetical protein P4V37_06335 [Bacillus subtilis]|uniref:hypothetical protein n=1 Tax=Bacillus TaxID=1386 RepID=UPI0005770103|nr:MULTISPECIES: hypothetical protein [Bacillus]MBW4824678.1 hypothetical protein [Bacillaceae bacterium]AJO58507.1 hypothetical protein QF06_08535 [Bacillus sp. YP1]ASB99668.1 hypothetical protein CD007_10065 [Bacillus subtilis]AXF33230.1 hypothetical protein DS740_10410 [Bacillus sp. DM2]AYF11550.1 hypothetical protein D3Z17_10760 [Bacillus subtilis]